MQAPAHRYPVFFFFGVESCNELLATETTEPIFLHFSAGPKMGKPMPAAALGLVLHAPVHNSPGTAYPVGRRRTLSSMDGLP